MELKHFARKYYGNRIVSRWTFFQLLYASETKTVDHLSCKDHKEFTELLHAIDIEHKLFKKSFKYSLGIRITISKIKHTCNNISSYTSIAT